MSPWTGRVLVTAAVWLGVTAAAYALGSSPRPGLMALVVAATAAVVFLLLDVSADVESARWPSPVPPPVRQPGEDARLARLQRVVAQHLESREVGDSLHRHLVELADQRLMERHGVHRAADPDRAARLLGPELAAVAGTMPPYPRMTIDEIETLVTRIEEL